MIDKEVFWVKKSFIEVDGSVWCGWEVIGVGSWRLDSFVKVNWWRNFSMYFLKCILDGVNNFVCERKEENGGINK